MRDAWEPSTGLEIAIVGMACRFPGAGTPAELWENLRTGTESITFFSTEELAAAGVPAALRDDPGYVPAQGVLDGVDRFDAELFGISPREASSMDPQHRLLLEAAWEALEDAGYAGEQGNRTVGVYAGAYYNTYLPHLAANLDLADPAVGFATNLANEKDYLATRIAYKLNLYGPALTVQTACSTSLVAVHLAGQGLLSGGCDLALAGGITARADQRTGYLFQPGGIFSSDGHTRAFDARADGTVASNGLGLVVLKRLEDALADGDSIRAVIRGSAIGNDGSDRIGFTAPGVTGQARVLEAALAMAGVDPATIGHVETHGSGTPVGDPIEIEALRRVYQPGVPGRARCAIGSIKSNIGHTHAAAGVAGLLKTVLALEHGLLPASLHFSRANPDIDFDATPFYVNTGLRPWPDTTTGMPRRAAVSSFGMGGTGAHVVVEQAPPTARTARTRSWQLMPVSARSAVAADAAVGRLATHLAASPELDLADVAGTQQLGRRHFDHRRVVVADGLAEAAEALGAGGTVAGVAQPGRSVGFMFAGLGDHRPGMARELYDTQPVFGAELDRCAQLLTRHLGLDLRTVLYPDDPAQPAGTGAGTGGIDLRAMAGRGGAPRAPGRDDPADLHRTRLAQPAVFAVEYALAQQWRAWGVEPAAMLGYSIGEYVAACLAGVLSLEDALHLVAARAALIDGLPTGGMLAVPLAEDRVRALLPPELSLAAVNGPQLCVVTGTQPAIDRLRTRLGAQGVPCRPVATTHAFHSHLMDPVAEPLTALAGSIRLSPPAIPYVSNVTGRWIEPHQATDPGYWARHLCQPVRFGDAVAQLAAADRVLLEVGPGQSLSSLAMQVLVADGGQGRGDPLALSTLPSVFDRENPARHLHTTAGRLWLAGIDLDFAALHAPTRPRRIPLPGYPFQRQRHWLDAAGGGGPARPTPSLTRQPDLADWFHVPGWTQLPPHPVGPAHRERAGGSWLLFADRDGLARQVTVRLREAGGQVTVVEAADRDGYRDLLAGLRAGSGRDGPVRLVHMLLVDDHDPERALRDGFTSLLHLGQALAGYPGAAPVELTVVTTGLVAVTDHDRIAPEKATVLGPCRVLPLENPQLTCRTVDIGPATTADGLVAELLRPAAPEPAGPELVALRGRDRWRPLYHPVRVEAADGRPALLRDRGVYLITGGAGGIGTAVARYLARTVSARLVLVGRRPATDPDLAAVVRELAALGGEAMAATADVTDPAALRAVAQAAVRRWGAVHGVVHAAGVPGGGLAVLTEPADAARVLAPKLAGTLAVDALARELGMDFQVFCSSVLALTGGVGQLSYTAGNAFCDALAHRRARDPDGPVTLSVDWDAWQDTGMAFRTIGSRVGPVDHPLLDRCLVDSPRYGIYTVELDPRTSWLIDEHRMLGHPVVPGTGHLELARAAFAHQYGTGPVELTDVTFYSPVVVDESRTRTLQVVVDKTDDPVRFFVVSPAADRWQLHASGSIRALADATPGSHDPAGLRERGDLTDLGRLDHTGPMGFGPRSRCLRRVYAGASEAMAELALPAAFAPETEQLWLHPSLLDLAAGFVGMNLAEEFRMPISYGRIRLFAPLPAELLSLHRFREADQPGKETFTDDFVLLDPAGREVAQVTGFVLKRVHELGGMLEQARAGSSPEVAYYRYPDLSGANRSTGGLLREHLEQGIRPEEGVEALARLLSGRLGPQVVVSAKPLDAVIAHIRAGRIDADGEVRVAPARVGTHPRPSLPTAYVEPADQLERDLAGLWQELLGVEPVGVDDRFFDLGGHSLLGLQLVARLRKQHGVELSLSEFFETRTVAELAATVRGRAEGETR